MYGKATILARQLALSIVWFSLIGATALQAQTYKVLHNFGTLGDGNQPVAPLVFDPQGNLYGTTLAGGTSPQPFGTVFELSPNLNGTWTENILHSFGGSGEAQFNAVVLDSRGNLYGETSGDGSQNFGTVYELSNNGNGSWALRNLYSFTAGTDGSGPGGGVVLGSANQIYGVASGGETHHVGLVFNVDHISVSHWAETVLHSFTGGSDGQYPGGPLNFDAAGNLYGVSAGGQYGNGTVFKMTPNHRSFGWTKSIVYAFQNPYGTPNPGLIFDAAGNIYGTGYEDGSHGYGFVYELTPNSDGTWTQTILHEFQGVGQGDGGYVNGSLIMDVAGNLYGTTQGGGYNGYRCSPAGCGTVFKLTPSNGQWVETILYEFSDVSGGWQPHDGVILDHAGNLYGTAIYGGTIGGGVAFEVTP